MNRLRLERSSLPSTLFVGRSPSRSGRLLGAALLLAGGAIAPAQFKPPLTIDIPGYGFHYAGMRYNGAAELYEGTIIGLTDGGLFEAGSAFYPIPQEISSFTTDFDFYNNPTPGVGVGDGFAFVIQTRGSEALGGLGGDFGFLGGYFNRQEALGVTFSPGPPETTIRLFRSGDFTLSQVPEPSPDLRVNNVNFYNGEYYSAHITYDGKMMVCTVSDVTGLHKASASLTFRGYPSSSGIPGDLDIPGILGSHYAYVGFSGGTGVNTASQHITGWTFRPGAPAAVPAPTFFPASGTKFQVPGPVTLTSPTPDSLISTRSMEARPESSRISTQDQSLRTLRPTPYMRLPSWVRRSARRRLVYTQSLSPLPSLPLHR